MGRSIAAFYLLQCLLQFPVRLGQHYWLAIKRQASHAGILSCESSRSKHTHAF
jgi:hypothetical protein